MSAAACARPDEEVIGGGDDLHRRVGPRGDDRLARRTAGRTGRARRRARASAGGVDRRAMCESGGATATLRTIRSSSTVEADGGAERIARRVQHERRGTDPPGGRGRRRRRDVRRRLRRARHESRNAGRGTRSPAKATNIASTTVLKRSPPRNGWGWQMTTAPFGVTGVPRRDRRRGSWPSDVVSCTCSTARRYPRAVATGPDKLPIKMLNDRLLVRIPDKDGERTILGRDPDPGDGADGQAARVGRGRGARARTCAPPRSATTCCSAPRTATRSRCRARTTSCCASATSTPSPPHASRRRTGLYL